MPECLLTPLRFPAGLVVPNRLWLAPMTNLQSHADGSLSEDELAWLVARARGGFGVIESCATHVSLDGQGWAGEWGIFSDALTPGWRRAAESIGEQGSHLFAQLFHAGERALREEGRRRLSCTAIPGEEVAEATEAEIEHIIEDFARGAERAVEAGLSGVELHGAHGYLLCQFLRADRNTRGDRWGGSYENRLRLIRTVMRTVRSRVPSTFVVGVRLSPENGTFLSGLDLDESLRTAAVLCEEGADFIHISLWDSKAMTAKRPEQHPARAFREALPAEVPVITAGEIWTAEDARGQREHGADAVALGRAGITTPDWPRRVAAEGGEPLRPPVTAEQLRERALGEKFVEYMRRWPGFVTEEES